MSDTTTNTTNSASIVALPNTLDGKELDKRIKSVSTRSKKLDVDIHALGVQAMMHAKAHGDVSKLTNLRNALGKSVRVAGFNLWVTDHVPVQWVTMETKGKAKVHKYKFIKDREASDFKIENANQTPFWDYSKEPAPVPYSLDKAEASAKSLLDRVLKAHQSGDISLDDIRTFNNDVSKGLRELKASVEAGRGNEPEDTETPETEQTEEQATA